MSQRISHVLGLNPKPLSERQTTPSDDSNPGRPRAEIVNMLDADSTPSRQPLSGRGIVGRLRSGAKVGP